MRWLPEFGGIIWLALLGAAIWFHTHASLQPPIYDAFTYYEKAWQFWSTMHRMQPFNPLNLQPTFRPPGTVLMSYPFGFNPDPRGFYFRSIYFPVVLLFLAVLATAYDVRDGLIVRAQTVLTAAFFCTPTILYQFEMGAGTGSYWGLVDGFLAGLAALAAAAAWRGTQASSAWWAWLWTAVAAFASCLSILVKPSGTLVAAVVGIAWVVFALARVVGVWSSCADRRRLIMRLLAGAVMIGALDGLVLLAAVSSRYLSRDNMQAGLANIAIMKTELSLPLDQLWPIVNAGFGGQFVVWIVLSAVLIPLSCRSVMRGIVADKPPASLVATVVGWFAILFGIWFWMIGSGGVTQIRYDVPFFMMALIWLLPGVVRSWPFASAARSAMTVVMVAASLNLVLILLVPKPTAAWQRLSGVGLTSNFPAPVMQGYQRLIEQPRTEPVVIYAFSLDVNDAVLDALADRSRLLHPELPPISVTRPVDWARPSTFRIKDIAAANYLLISPEQGGQISTAGAIVDLRAEQRVFTKWADELTEADGVTVFLAVNSAKVLRIVNRQAFRTRLDRMVNSHNWNPVFEDANRIALNFGEQVADSPAGYSFCATENGTCNFSGTQNVAYGADGVFYYKYGVTGGSIACNNATFGDPRGGYVKSCYVTGGSGGGKGTAHKFTGYERDSETGNNYASARYYGSREGSFFSTDPIGGDPSDPQSLNRYP